jgi:hypothetical protein
MTADGLCLPLPQPKFVLWMTHHLVPSEFRRRADFAKVTSAIHNFCVLVYDPRPRQKSKERTMRKTQKPLTLLQLWAAKRVKQENEVQEETNSDHVRGASPNEQAAQAGQNYCGSYI